MTHPLATLCTIALLVPALPVRGDELGLAEDVPAAFDAQPLSLRAAVARALEGSHEARVGRLERGRADDELAARRGAYWPQLSVSAQAGYSNRLNDSFFAFDDDGDVAEYGLSNLANDPWLSVVVDQVLIDLRRWRELEREELAAQAAAIAERDGRERVALEVVRRYARQLGAERDAFIAQQGLDACMALDEQADRLEQAGRVLSNERLQVKLARDTARMDLRAAQAAVRSARSALWLALDGGPEPTAWPGLVPASLPELELENPGGSSAASFEEQLVQAPDLQILELQRRIREASVAAVRAARYPSLQLRGGYQHYGIKRFDQFEDEAFVFVGMELPLFDGFQNSSKLASARKAADVARVRHESALASKRAQVRDLRSQLELTGQRLELTRRRAELTGEARRLADLQLKSQRGGLDAALRAREQLQRDLRAASGLHFQQLELWAMLQRELGLLADSLTGKGPTAALPSAP